MLSKIFRIIIKIKYTFDYSKSFLLFFINGETFFKINIEMKFRFLLGTSIGSQPQKTQDIQIFFLILGFVELSLLIILVKKSSRFP
jgi:hypothetical protein